MSDLSTDSLRGMAFNMMQRFELTAGYAQGMNQAADESDILRNKLVAAQAINEHMQKRNETLEAVVNEQCEDGGLWFDAMSAPEAYVQQELLRLHRIIELSPKDTE